MTTTQPAAVDPVAAVVVIVITVAVAFGLTMAILRAAHYPHPTSMVTALSLLTLLSLMGLAISSGETANTFGTLAATGLGALAGAVTSQFGAKPKPPLDEPKPKPKRKGNPDGENSEPE